jgi:hypothetical protein
VDETNAPRTTHVEPSEREYANMTTHTSETMLVRTAAGAWEQLQPQVRVSDGGLAAMFGQDIGPVLGLPAPLVVVANSPRLATGTPDALCLDAEGNLTVVVLELGGSAEGTLPALLGYAGSLHGMSFADFERLCNCAHGAAADSADPDASGLAGFVARHTMHPAFHRGTFEVTVADALAQGRFNLVALVRSAPATLLQSARYLNASGASVSCYETSSFASESVFAVQARAVDVGQAPRDSVLRMTAAGLFAVTERTQDERTAKLMAQLQKFCAAAFDEVAYDGDAQLATMSASLHVGDNKVLMLNADSSGKVNLSFEALAPVDKNWTVRAELCQSMNRMLGADLGDVKKISQLNLTIREHLMDATLMEALTEIVGDTVSQVREAAGLPPRAALSAA